MTKLECAMKKYPNLSKDKIMERCPSFYNIKDFDICNNKSGSICESCWNSKIEIR